MTGRWPRPFNASASPTYGYTSPNDPQLVMRILTRGFVVRRFVGQFVAAHVSTGSGGYERIADQ